MKSGYTYRKNNTKLTQEFREQLQFLIDNDFLELIQSKDDIYNVMTYPPSDYFAVHIRNDLGVTSRYVPLTVKEVDTLLTIDADKSKVFSLYLYMKSFMYIKKRNLTPIDLEYDGSDKFKPCAFYGELDMIIRDIGLSTNFINNCLPEFVRLGLFKKKVVGSCIKPATGKKENVPNIYVLNDEYSDIDIELVMKRFRHLYKTDTFMGLIKRDVKKHRKKIEGDTS